MGHRSWLVPWGALLLVGCARDNPEFGLEGGAGTAAVDTQSGDDGASTGGPGSGSTTGVVPGTSTGGAPGSDTVGDTDPNPGSDADTGIGVDCVFIELDVVADTFVDGTAYCANGDDCSQFNFGGSDARTVGSSPTGAASVYLMEFPPNQLPRALSLVSARLHVPLAGQPSQGGFVLVFPVPAAFVAGTATGTINEGASSWSHRMFSEVPWDDPGTGTDAPDFGAILDWAIGTGVVFETPYSLADLAQQEDPLLIDAKIPTSDLFALELLLKSDVAPRLGLTMDGLGGDWSIRAQEGGGRPARLILEACER